MPAGGGGRGEEEYRDLSEPQGQSRALCPVCFSWCLKCQTQLSWDPGCVITQPPPGVGDGTPLQHSCLENCRDRGPGGL